MENRILKALDGAIASKGKNKGQLKVKCPPMGTDAAIMWQALMTHANPYKVGMAHMIYGAHIDPEFYQACQEYADAHAKVLPRLDRDRVALDRLGAW